MLRSKSCEKDDTFATSASLAPSEDDDKGGKRRRKQSRARSAAAFFAILGFLFLVVMVKLNHQQKYIPPKLRSAARAYSRALKNHPPDSSLTGNTADTFLPPNSIYKLSVPDLSGSLVSLEKFYGMVTLVVNVACL
jgi:hypothetical protein